MKRFSLKTIILTSFLAVAGIFGVANAVIDKQVEETPTIEKANAASENVDTIKIYAADQITSNYQYSRRLTYHNSDGDQRPMWVEINNSDIEWVDGSGYSSVSDITETIAAHSYVRTQGNDKYLRIKLWHAQSYNNEHNWQAELPWYIKKIRCYFFVQYNSVDWYLQEQNNNATYIDITRGWEGQIYFLKGNWWLNWDTSGKVKYASHSVPSYPTHQSSVEYKNITISSGTGGSVTPSVTNKKYYYGQILDLTATANEGYYFSSWSDSGAQNHRVVVGSSTSTSLTASFLIYKYSVTYTAGEGSGTNVVVNNINHGSSITTKSIGTSSGQCNFTAPTFKKFSLWKDDEDVTHAANVSMTVTRNMTLTAQWQYFTLQYSKNGGAFTDMTPLIDTGGLAAKYETDSAISQSHGDTFAFRYYDASNAVHNITPNGYVGSGGDATNNFGLDNDPLVCKFNNVSGKIEIRVVYESSTLKFYTYAHGMDDKKEETCRYSLIVDNDFYESTTQSANSEWIVLGVTIKPNQVVKFISSNTNSVYRPNYLNTYSYDLSCFTYTSTKVDDGHASITSTNIVCAKGGVFDVYLQSFNGTGNTIYFQRKTWTINFDMNGHGEQVEEQYVTRGSAPAGSMPTASEEGYTFDNEHWYTNKDCTSPYTWGSNVGADITLYAKWTINSYDVTITAGSGISSVYLSTNTSGSSPATNFNYGSTVYAFAVLQGGYAHNESAWSTYVLISGTADTAGAVYRIGSLTVDTSGNDFGTINAVSGETAAINYAKSFNTKVGAVCAGYNTNTKANFIAVWNTDETKDRMEYNYSQLPSYVKYWLTESTKSSDSNVTAMLAKYDYVLRKYGYGTGSDNLHDFLDRTPTPRAAVSTIRSFTPFSMINGEDGSDNATTIIIIIASSISLLSITTLGVLILKKRKSKAH